MQLYNDLGNASFAVLIIDIALPHATRNATTK